MLSQTLTQHLSKAATRAWAVVIAVKLAKFKKIEQCQSSQHEISYTNLSLSRSILELSLTEYEIVDTA